MFILNDDQIKTTLNKDLSSDQLQSIRVLLTSQLRKMAWWGKEQCEYQNTPRRGCGHCWQYFLEEVDLKNAIRR